MLKSIEIKNFRAFTHLSIDGLSRLNLFTGQNGVGKTCLLEALFLHLGAHNSEISARLNVFRGLRPVAPDAKETWGWLLYNRRIQDTAVVTSIDDEGCRRELRVSLRSPTIKIKPKDEAQRDGQGELTEVGSAPQSPQELILAFAQDGSKSEARAVFQPDGVRFDVGGNPVFPPSFLLTTRHRSEKELADKFAGIEEQLREGEVFEMLRIIEPRLKRLAIAVVGDALMLKADVGIDRLIPIALLGEGLARVASVALSILNASDGCVLVDEIENGVHHSLHERIWEALLSACRKENVQLFATSHSRECALAAHRAFSKSLQFDYEFAAYRLERKKDPEDEGLIQAVPLTQATLDTADELDWEVR